jgi:hypothetical protein
MVFRIIKQISRYCNRGVLCDAESFSRNYYEHIIRDEKSQYGISEYIENNPKKRKDDQFWVEI